MANIDDGNPIIILDTPRCLANLIRKYSLNQQEEYDRGSLARYAEDILQIARDTLNITISKDDYERFNNYMEDIMDRIAQACEHIGAFEGNKSPMIQPEKDPTRYHDRLLYQKTRLAEDMTKLKNHIDVGNLTGLEIRSKLKALEDRYVRLRTTDDDDYYEDATGCSIELIDAFKDYCLKYNLRNATTYISHLNDYQMSIEIYRL